jgi:hypothetical protein
MCEADVLSKLMFMDLSEVLGDRMISIERATRDIIASRFIGPGHVQSTSWKPLL